MNKEDWTGFQSVEDSDINLKDLVELCDQLTESRREYTKLELFLSQKHEDVKNLENRILNYLEAANMPSFETANCKVIRAQRFSVKTPKTMEEKKLFFDYLKTRGHFDGLISVNSNTLSAYIKTEIEQKELEGVMDWTPPGIEAPKKSFYLSVKNK